jgi:hypothetical protein
MSKNLEQLKMELRDDFGKLTCWQWLCQEKNATSELAQIAVAEEVLAMPRMDNVAAAQTYRSRLQGKNTGSIKDLLAGRHRDSLTRVAPSETVTAAPRRRSRTVPIKNDKEFLDLDVYVTLLLEKKGYKRVQRSGSTSWVDRRLKPVDVAVRFKLRYLGPKDIDFGVRRDFVLSSGLTPAQIGCPETIVVSSVVFAGFAVQNDKQSRLRIAKVIDAFP